jgi:hypothetical protein
MHVVPLQAPLSAATEGSPLMVCTSDAVRSVLAGAVVTPEPPMLPMPGMVIPPDDFGVGVVLLDDPPQPAIPTMAPMDNAPTRSDLVFIEFLAVVRQRSLRAESPQMITAEKPRPTALPNRKNHFTLVQSKQ